MAEMSMSDILSDKPAEKPAEAPKEQLDLPAVDKPAADATKDTPPATERPSSRKQAHRDKEQDAQGRVRDPETGQYTSKEAPAAETAPAKDAEKEPAKELPKEPAKPAIAAQQQEFTEKEKAFQRAMMEERGKRQALEQRLAAIEANKPAEAPKTFWDDPEAALAKHRAEISNVTTNVRLQTAELIARQKHSDFDAKIEVFGQVLQQTPGLHAQWLAASDPAEFAYNIGKNHMELQAAGSMEEMRAKIERETAARVRAEVEAELKAKADALARDRAALPGSLSDARASGVNKVVWGGPTSMTDIISGK